MLWPGRAHPSWACAVAFFLALGAPRGAVFAQGAEGLGAPAQPSTRTEPKLEASAERGAASAPTTAAASEVAPDVEPTFGVAVAAGSGAAPAGGVGPGAGAPLVVVFAPELTGVDAGIGPPLQHQLMESGAQLGYAAAPPDRVEQAAAQVGLGQPAAMSELWRVLYLCQAQAGLYARVWAEDGQYVIEMTGALLDGRGPFVQRRHTDHLSFLQTVNALVREVLPGAGLQGRDQAAPVGTAVPAASPATLFEPKAEDLQPDEPSPPVQRFGFAATAESVFGVGQGGFYNQLIGARVDVRLTHEIAVGAYLGYANLQGYQGRVGNLATYLQLEDRLRLGDRTKLRIPLRFGAGFVPRNGALIRFAAGLSMPVNDHVELGLDLLSPTLWILPEGEIAASLSLALEIIVSP